MPACSQAAMPSFFLKNSIVYNRFRGNLIIANFFAFFLKSFFEIPSIFCYTVLNKWPDNAPPLVGSLFILPPAAGRLISIWKEDLNMAEPYRKGEYVRYACNGVCLVDDIRLDVPARQRHTQGILHPETCQQPGLHHFCSHRQSRAGGENGPGYPTGRN